MSISKYLAIGSRIASKYEVMDVLGEDDFEILYLVRDIHRKGSFFVLKELFLETFSARRENLVYTIPEARGVFNKRKEQIIDEINLLKSNGKSKDIQLYGYEEDNSTIYSIMEFSNNASLEKYLQFTPKDRMSLPTLDELLNKKGKGLNYFLFLKIILIIGIILAVAFYAYEFLQKKLKEDNLKSSEILSSISPPKLKERVVIEELNVTKPVINIIEKIKPQVPLVESVVHKIEDNLSVKAKTINDVIIEEEVLKEETSFEPQIEENLSLLNDEEIIPVEDNVTRPIEETMKVFLDAYIEVTSGTNIEETLSYYAANVKRYFRFRNPTHAIIRKSQERYNQKWLKREFKILDFEIIKTYKKNNESYYEVRTTTSWMVSSRKTKNLSGKSKGIMHLKKLESGFEIISIYSSK